MILLPKITSLCFHLRSQVSHRQLKTNCQHGGISLLLWMCIGMCRFLRIKSTPLSSCWPFPASLHPWAPQQRAVGWLSPPPQQLRAPSLEPINGNLPTPVGLGKHRINKLLAPFCQL